MGRVNLLTAPSFEYATSGFASLWNHQGNITGTLVHTRVEDVVVAGGYAQRLEYTGVAGDSPNKVLYLTANGTAAGSFVEADPVTASAYLWGATSGVTLVMRAICCNAANAVLATFDSSLVTLDATPTRYSATGTCPAGTSYVQFEPLHFTGISNGDTIDAYIDAAMVEKSDTLTDYFDGDSPNTADWAYQWSGSPHLSTSVEIVYFPGVTCLTNVPVPVPLVTALGEILTCAKVANKNFAVDIDTEDIAVSASTDYATSLYLTCPDLVAPCTVTVETGHSFELAALTEASDEWTRYDVATPTVGGETTLHLKFAFGDGGASTVYATGMTLAPTLIDFFDGSFDNCAWAAAANASASIRTLDVD
jgi:hypothetical protein